MIASARPPLEIELLGQFRLSLGGVPLAQVSTIRQRSLLAYLVLHGQHPQPRGQIAAAFWPDSSADQALTNLRRELHQLRRDLPHAEEYLSVDHRQLRWRPESPYSLDVALFEQHLQTGSREALEEALRLYRGELFPGCYDDWIVPERERLHRLGVQAFERLIAALEEAREYRAALEQAHRLLDLEPLHEGAYRVLMRLHALQGERAAALHAYHTCVSVLERELDAKPSAETQALYQSLLESPTPAEARGPVPALLAGTYPLVGRQAERGVLRHAWERAALGQASCLVIQGEAGIGKTRLAEDLLEWCTERGIASARTRCYAAEGRLAFAPVSEWLRSEDLRARLDALEPVWLTEVARLLPELLGEHPNLPQPQALSEGWQRRRFFEALARCFLSDQRPLLLVLDDLQWCDPDTLEWLHYLLRSDPQARLLLVCSLRFEERQDNPALQAFLRDLRQLGRLVELELGPLSEAETAELAAQMADQPPDDEFGAELFRQTEGHPLFVVEMARSGLNGFADAQGGHLPPRVQAVIAARLAQLSVEARGLVELAAVIGRDFDYEVLREASDLDEKSLVRALDEVWQRRIIREQGTLSYDFSHDQLREVSAAEVSPARRRLLHRRVAQALELIYRDDPDSVVARLAYHHEEAGQAARAIACYQRSAQVAQRVSANEEAIRALSRALLLLQQLPAGLERDRQELALHVALSHPLMTVRGYSAPEVEAAVVCIGQLGRRLGDREAIINSLLGLQGVYYVRGEIRKALNLAYETRKLAEGSPGWLLASEWAIGGASIGIGALNLARAHLERAIAGYDPEHPTNTVLGPDLAVFSLSWETHALWLLGEEAQALNYHRRAVDIAGRLENPFNLTLAYAYGAILHQMRQNRDGVLACTKMVLELCDRHGFVYYRDWGLILSGWADLDAARVRRGLDNLHALDAGTRRPYYLGLLAEVHAGLGQGAEARPILDAALATAARNEDLWWNAELHRLKGEVTGSESCLHTALEVARAQESRALELRAAVSLARRWQAGGRRREALELLEPICGWFGANLETPDLLAARDLIRSLRA